MTEIAGAQTESRTAAADQAPVFSDILCAIDGREGGFTAVAQAAALAGAQGLLTLLGVTSFRAEGTYRAPAIPAGQMSEILERAEAIARDAGVPFVSEVDPGTPPAAVILDWSERYELLALGAPASSWLPGLFNVGVGDQALTGFATALLVARPAAAERRFADRVVVASDGLEHSDVLVDFAGRLAQAHASELTLLHALGHEVPIRHHHVRERERRLEQQQARLARVLTGGTSELRVEPGHAHEVIAATARDIESSLVVMGSRRLEGLRSIGSVSRRVAHEAPCSVLLVPPETLAR